jgi:hypothetical protein
MLTINLLLAWNIPGNFIQVDEAGGRRGGLAAPPDADVHREQMMIFITQ